VLYVGPDPTALTPYFHDVRPLGGQGKYRTWLLTGRTQPWGGFWPGLHRLGVV
jgi:hypothetical protein